MLDIPAQSPPERGFFLPAKHHDLQVLIGRLSREMPGTIAGFTHLRKEATAAGALNAKFKELVALGVAVMMGTAARRRCTPVKPLRPWSNSRRTITRNDSSWLSRAGMKNMRR